MRAQSSALKGSPKCWREIRTDLTRRSEKPENGQSCPIDVSARSTERRTRSSKQGQERESFSTRMSKEAWLRMRALLFLGLVLVNLALLVHLSEKALRFRKRWKDHKLLVNNHPEMKSVDPEQGLLAFKSDDMIPVSYTHLTLPTSYAV